MSHTPKSEKSSAPLLVGGFVLLHVLCCGLPLLLAAGVLGGFGGLSLWAGNGWLAALAAVAAMALVVWFFRRRRPSEEGPADCCGPEGSAPTRADAKQEADLPADMVAREARR